jgi:hypothetical protein
MPRFSSQFDHRLDNQITRKEDLRFHEQETAEDFATAQYCIDFIPRSVILGATGKLMVLESPEPRLEGYIPHPDEVFYINSTPGEG